MALPFGDYMKQRYQQAPAAQQMPQNAYNFYGAPQQQAQQAPQQMGAMGFPAQQANPYMPQQAAPQQPQAASGGGGGTYNPYSPYLANQMAATVDDAATQFLTKINPALTSQAILAGGYGGDRANLAAATAASDQQRNLASTIAGMQSQDWQAGQGFGLQQGNLDLQRMLGLGNLQLGQGRLALDTTLGQGNLALGQGRLALDQTLGKGNLANQARGLDIQQQLGMGNLQNQMAIAQMQNQLGYAGLGNQASIAQMQNQTQRDLGMGQLGLGYTQAANQYNLGLGNLGLGYTQANNAYDLGQQNVGLGYAGLGNQYNIAQMGNDTTRMGQMLNYDLGLGNQGINEFNAQVAAQRGFNQDQLATALGFGNLGINQFNALSGAYNNAGQLDLGGYNANTNRMNVMGNLGISAGQLANQTQQINNQFDLGNRGLDAQIYQQLMNNDLGWAQNYNQYYGNTIPNLMNANTAAAGQPVYTNPLGSAIGGGLTLAQLLGMGW